MEQTTEHHSQAASSNFGSIVACGWLNLKIRSMVNVRPRHLRYCILSKESGVLSTFKFQPSSGDLNFIRPLRGYKIKSVDVWRSRKCGLLVTVIQQIDQVERVLELMAPSEPSAREWLHGLRVITGEEDECEGDFATYQFSPDSDPSPSTSPCLKPIDEMTKRGKHILLKGPSIHRGLLNSAGENSCFLNVIIQSFWHLQSMRQFLLNAEIKQEVVTVEANVLRALQSIMRMYDDTSSGALDSRALRKGLSVLYRADKNFQEGMMYDAEETLLALLNIMHQETDVTQAQKLNKSAEVLELSSRTASPDDYTELPEAVYDANSIPHVVFSHQIYDRYLCGTCHHTSAWDLYSNLVFTTYATYCYSWNFKCMEDMLRYMSTTDVAPACDETGCNGRYIKQRSIHRFPMVFAMSILWATDSASTGQVQQLLFNISNRIDLAKAFDAAGPATEPLESGFRTFYHLRGFVCYYGRHYVAVFYSSAHNTWLLFDDSRVLDLGAWHGVVSQCLKGRFQPILLFYELPDHQTQSFSSATHSKSSSLNGFEETSIHHQNEEVELSRNSSRAQDSTLVAPSIAMQPRTIAVNSPLQPDEYTVRFDNDCRVLGMYLEKIDGELCVTSFPRDSKDGMFGAEKTGQVQLYDAIVHANGHTLSSLSVDRALQMIKAQQRPLIIRFRRTRKLNSLIEMGFSRVLAVEALNRCKGNVEAAANFCFEKHHGT